MHTQVNPFPYIYYIQAWEDALLLSHKNQQ